MKSERYYMILGILHFIWFNVVDNDITSAVIGTIGAIYFGISIFGTIMEEKNE